MEITAVIAENLSRWMEQHPSLNTLKKVSAKSGVGFGTIRRCRNGDGNPTITNLADIASAFGRSLDDLLKLPDYPTGDNATTLQARERETFLAPLEEELLGHARRMNERGVILLIDQAEQIASRHPKAQPKAA